MERRRFYRAGPHMSVRVDGGDGLPVCGQVRNVSLQGLLVTCQPPLPRGTSCAVTISLGAGGHAIRGHATVVRETADGVALHITSLDDPDSYRHLCNLVMYNADDPDLVKRQIEGWIRHRTAPRPRRAGARPRLRVVGRPATID